MATSEPEQPQAPNQRSFSLNSDEAYGALCPRSDAWIPNGALLREPRSRDRPVIVETTEPMRASFGAWRTDEVS